MGTAKWEGTRNADWVGMGTVDWGVMGTADWGVMGTVDWGVMGTADWGVMGIGDWGVMETADWGFMRTACWGIMGTADWGATTWQRILQQELQTVHLTVDLLLTARVSAVCDCLLRERSVCMRSHGVMCRVSAHSDKLLLV